MSEIPHSWVSCQLFEISDVVTGKTPSKKHDEYFNGAIPFIKPGDVRNQGVIDDTEETLTEIGANTVPCIPPNSITVTCIGNLGRTAITKVLSATNQQINSVIPHENISAKFVYYYLQTIKNWMESEASSTTVTIINKGRFLKAPVILAPANEQICIANKLDSLLAKVDTAQARLEKIPTLLKRFRQSVLAAATSGELTREWREENSPDCIQDYSLKTAVERKNKGIRETKHSKNAAVDKEPFEIPSSWQWIRLGHIALKITDGAHNTPQVLDSGYPYLMAKDLTGGVLDFSENRFISEKDHRELYCKCLPELGDLLVVNIGAGTGNNVLINVDFEFSFKNIAIIKRPIFVVAEYLKYFFDAEKKRIFDEQTRGGAQPFLSLTMLNDIPFALPSIEEQTEIVRRVESLFALADTVEKQYLAAKQRLDRLSQSLLAKAFRGELVPQDPNDEPAAELLKRIQAERQAQPAAKQKRSKPA
jgi:type I restriction enzyme S subunit